MYYVRIPPIATLSSSICPLSAYKLFITLLPHTIKINKPAWADPNSLGLIKQSPGQQPKIHPTSFIRIMVLILYL